MSKGVRSYLKCLRSGYVDELAITSYSSSILCSAPPPDLGLPLLPKLLQITLFCIAQHTQLYTCTRRLTR